MAANTPPLPHEEGNTFTNEDTGVKYEFINGAWRAVGSKAVEDLLSQIEGAAIYYGDYEPIVGAYELWYDTTRLELFVNYEGMWFPAAAGSGGGGGTQDLEQVLQQGNVADKGFILTNAENDALLVSPEEARIMVGGFGDDVIPRYELRHTDDRSDSAAVLLELDEGGKRFDIECDNKVENIHFRFGDEAKLDINKKGDAVFQGKVQVQPGTKDNEVVTFQQLQEIEEEIEDIRPTLERGVWEFAETGPSPGKYALLRENTPEYCNAVYLDCIAENPNDPTLMSQCGRERDACIGNDPENPPRGYIDEWVSATELVTSNIDFDNVTHQWPDAEAGEFLEVINEDGSGFALYQIEGEVNTAYQGRTRFYVKHMRSNGTPSGKAKVKLFAINEEVDPTEFVHKTGDTMSGRLNIFSKEAATLELRAGGPASSTASVFWIEDASRNHIFNVGNSGSVMLKDGWTPDNDRHVTPKKFVDDNFLKKTGGTLSNRLTIQPTNTTNSLVIYSNETASSNQYSIYNYGQQYTPEGSDTPKRDVIFYTTVGGDIGGGTNWLPSKSFHLANKKYVDNATKPAPVNFSWKYTGPDNQSDRLIEGEFYGPAEPVFDGSSYFSWYFHLTPRLSNGVKFGSYDDKILYHFSNFQVLGNFWFNNGGEWKQKGHVWIKELEFKYKSRNVIRVQGYHIRHSSDDLNKFTSAMSQNQTYGFTIGGFF